MMEKGNKNVRLDTFIRQIQSVQHTNTQPVQVNEFARITIIQTPGTSVTGQCRSYVTLELCNGMTRVPPR
jgi:hypothetical protein